MPRIKPRRGRFQVGNALAAGISGYQQGKQQAETQQRQERLTNAQIARYEEADQRAQRDLAQKQAQREILMSHATRATKSVRGGMAEQQERRVMKPEQKKYFQSKMIQFQASAQKMVEAGFPRKEIESFANEYREGMEQEMFALEYQAIDKRLYEMGLDEEMQYDPKIIEDIRKAMTDPDEMASPNAINATIDNVIKTHAANAGQRRRVERNVEGGNALLSPANPDFMEAASAERDKADAYFLENRVSMEWDELKVGIKQVLAGGIQATPFDRPAGPEPQEVMDMLFNPQRQPPNPDVQAIEQQLHPGSAPVDDRRARLRAAAEQQN